MSNIEEKNNANAYVNLVLLIHFLIIIIGVIGNLLVILMFAFKKNLRNARNAFIVIFLIINYNLIMFLLF